MTRDGWHKKPSHDGSARKDLRKSFGLRQVPDNVERRGVEGVRKDVLGLEQEERIVDCEGLIPHWDKYEERKKQRWNGGADGGQLHRLERV